MSLKISSALAVNLLLLSLAVSLGASGAAAASGDRPGVAATHRVHRTVHRWHQFARRVPPPTYHRAIPPNAIVGPGYVFVPGVGILDESCDLPTSACPNSARDIQ